MAVQPHHDHAAMIAAQPQAGGNAEDSGGFFANLLEVYTPRRLCMNMEQDVIWLHLVSDVLIATSYFSIPLALIYFVRRRKDLSFDWMFMLFAAFILACGTTHVFGVIAIWKPYYRLDGLVKLGTGVVSVATAILLWPLVSKAVHLPSPSMLRVANEKLAAEVLTRQAAEEEARRMSAELERRVEERTAELESVAAQRNLLLESERSAREAAEQANRVKDDFVATLSHELRTPINAITGWAHLLRENPTRPDASHGLEVIERNTKAQARMIDDLLDMSKIISGKLRLDVQPVDLRSVIEAAVETVRPAAEAREVRLTTVIDPRCGLVRGDFDRLQQVVWNLLSNAIKFTGRGGRVQVSLLRVNSHLEIVVEDTGKGISPEFLSHVFDRFRQEDTSITRSHGGLGLGLSIVRHLVELHGGTVVARSEGEGKGSTFTVSLPLSAVGTQDDRHHPVRAGESGRPTVHLPSNSLLIGLRLLVVDDEADTRDLLHRVLSEHGANVVTAASAKEVMALLTSGERFDALVSDIGMPDEDGYMLIRRVRAMPGGANTQSKLPAVALTAFARSEDRTRAMVAGYQAHVSKPADISELVATIASLTGRITDV